MLGAVLRHTHLITMSALLTEARSIRRIVQKYLKHDKNIFSVALTMRTFLTRCARLSNGLMQSARFLKPSGLSQGLLIRRQNTLNLDINTNVQNNVILYKYENERYFRNILIFGIGQLFGWSVLAVYTYSPSFFDIFKTDITFKEYFDKNIVRLLLCNFSLFIGPMICSTLYAFRTRSVKYIILKKGGKNITLTTYHPLNSKSNTNIPVNMITCVKHRTEPGDYIPMKIQDKYFYYVADKRGIFPNPILFDHTVGYGSL